MFTHTQTLRQEGKSFRKRISGTVNVYEYPKKINVSESEVLHFLLVQALKDKFEETRQEAELELAERYALIEPSCY
ncbi:hypothetical protein [Pseudomonas sp. p1(2021b)]|uniref:hypothetical protein n=1 Tax=Pseudomonas sp. p1(2021b) TaxID=2874628 RepID=UPI003D273B8E